MQKLCPSNAWENFVMKMKVKRWEALIYEYAEACMEAD
jgi:hypothetical protein